MTKAKFGSTTQATAEVSAEQNELNNLSEAVDQVCRQVDKLTQEQVEEVILFLTPWRRVDPNAKPKTPWELYQDLSRTLDDMNRKLYVDGKLSSDTGQLKDMVDAVTKLTKALKDARESIFTDERRRRFEASVIRTLKEFPEVQQKAFKRLEEAMVDMNTLPGSDELYREDVK